MGLFSNILISASTASLTFSAAALADIDITQNEGIWAVTAEGEPLSEVLSALQAEAGFRLTGADRIIEDNPVTADISGSLGDVLARLLAGFDYALVYGETAETADQLQRLVLLSGRSGDAPDESQRLTVEQLPGGLSAEDGARVSDLLARQVQPLMDAETANDTSRTGETAALATTPAPPASATGTSDNDDPELDPELDPETQAALAEATRRAQQDLQALVNALQAAENDSGN